MYIENIQNFIEFLSNHMFTIYFVLFTGIKNNQVLYTILICFM